MTKIRRDAVIVLLFCLVVGGYIIYACQQFPDAHGGQGFGQGAGFYPQVLAWFMILLGVLAFVDGLRKSAAARVRDVEVVEPPRPVYRYPLVAAIIAVSLIDIVLTRTFGFFIAGFLLVLAMIELVRPTRDLKTILCDLLFSAGMVAVVYVVFEAFIHIQLPRGILFH